MLSEDEKKRLCEEAVDKLNEAFTDETNESQLLVEAIQNTEVVIGKKRTKQIEFFADIDLQISQVDLIGYD